MKTLQLSEAWDLALTPGGHLAALDDDSRMESRVAQDVACAARLFRGEAYFRPAAGVPYFADELGRLPPARLIRMRADAAALSVPGVKSASTELEVGNARDERTGLPTRTVRGNIRVTTTKGEEVNVNL